MSTSSISLPSIPEDDGIHFSEDNPSDTEIIPDDSSLLHAPPVPDDSTTSSTDSVAHNAIASSAGRAGLSTPKAELRNKARAFNRELHDFQEVVAKQKGRETEIIKSPAAAIGLTGLLLLVIVICVVVFGIFTGGVGIALIMPMMVAGGLMAAYGLSKYQHDLTNKQLPYTNVEDELGKLKKFTTRLNQLIDDPNKTANQKHQEYLKLQSQIREANDTLGDALNELNNTASAKCKKDVLDAVTTTTALWDAIQELDDAITAIRNPGAPAPRPIVNSDEDDDSHVDLDAENTASSSEDAHASITSVNIDGADSDDDDGDISPGSEESD